MSKLLPTQLPQAQGDTVSADTFNRLVRILEINLGSVDPDSIKSFNSTDISELQFATGAIIFNSTTEVHQALQRLILRCKQEGPHLVLVVTPRVSSNAARSHTKTGERGKSSAERPVRRWNEWMYCPFQLKHLTTRSRAE